jgi:hypothetical protein
MTSDRHWPAWPSRFRLSSAHGRTWLAFALRKYFRLALLIAAEFECITIKKTRPFESCVDGKENDKPGQPGAVEWGFS